MLLYHRWDQGGPGDDVVILANFSSQAYPAYTLGLPRPGIWRVRLNSDAQVYDPTFSNWPSFDTEASGPALNTMPCSGTIAIGAYTCLILSQD